VLLRGFGNLRLQDFEPQIVEYPQTKHDVAGFTAITDLLRSGSA